MLCMNKKGGVNAALSFRKYLVWGCLFGRRPYNKSVRHMGVGVGPAGAGGKDYELV